MANGIQRLSSHCSVLVVLLGQLLVPAGVSGQEASVPLQFNFSDPGARSMGFGGAFVALADDATAAFSNPAGLTQILKPELSIEGRSWSYSTPYTEGGRAEGLPSGLGIDSTVGLRTATSDVDITGLSFLSFVIPKGRWSLAFYRHDLANFEFFSETQGLFGGGTDCCQTRDFDMRAANDLDIVSYGLSAAYRISDKFDLGLGLIYYDTSFVTNATLFRTDDDSPASIVGLNSYLPERTVLNERIFFDDSDTALSAGFLWRLSDKWRIGGVYRQAYEVNLGVELTAGETFDPGVTPGDQLLRLDIMLEMPTMYGLGLAYRDPDGRLTVSFQWDQVKYSNIVDSLRLDDRAMDDIDELHLGAEYVFIDSTPIVAVRFGAWLEPDHQLRARPDNVFAQALLPRGKDEIHLSAGFGVAMERLQIDVAADFADHLDTVSLSMIYNF